MTDNPFVADAERTEKQARFDKLDRRLTDAWRARLGRARQTLATYDAATPFERFLNRLVGVTRPRLVAQIAEAEEMVKPVPHGESYRRALP